MCRVLGFEFDAPGVSKGPTKISSQKRVGEQDEVIFLDKSRIDEVMELQDIVIGNLKKKYGEDQTFVYPVKKEDFLDGIEKKNVVGFVVNEKLVGICRLKEVELSSQMKKFELKKVYELGTAMVHPECRSKGRMKKMTGFLNELAKKRGIKGIYSVSDIRNPGSFLSLMKEESIIYDISIDPSDNGPIYELIKIIDNDKFYRRIKEISSKATKRIRLTDFDFGKDVKDFEKSEKFKKLQREFDGYFCIGYETPNPERKKEKVLILAKESIVLKALGVNNKEVQNVRTV